MVRKRGEEGGNGGRIEKGRRKGGVMGEGIEERRGRVEWGWKEGGQSDNGARGWKRRKRIEEERKERGKRDEGMRRKELSKNGGEGKGCRAG